MSFGRLSPLSTVSRRRAALLGVAASMALVVTACGGDDDSGSTDEPSAAADTANALELNGEWPLTGETLDGDLPAHPVYVVKIDNTSASAPQVGLGQADLIVEELVEGGLTRLAVFFYSETPEVVGPVRSMRASDVGIIEPAAAQLVASGGAPSARRIISDAGIVVNSEGSTGFYRDDSRSAPYNLFMNLSEAAAKPGKDWEAPPEPYLTFGSADDFQGDIPAKRIEASFSGAHSTNWKYDGDAWVVTDGYASSDDAFTADNVLILRVRTGDAGYLDPAGNPVPETYFYGKGKGILVHGDKALEVSWSKDGTEGAVKLSTKNGDVTVPSGHTYIELVPKDGGSVTIGK